MIETYCQENMMLMYLQ